MNDVIEQFPEARFHRDYREMLANHADDFDAVVISTPDHHHCHAASLAMRAGKPAARASAASNRACSVQSP